MKNFYFGVNLSANLWCESTNRAQNKWNVR